MIFALVLSSEDGGVWQQSLPVSVIGLEYSSHQAAVAQLREQEQVLWGRSQHNAQCQSHLPADSVLATPEVDLLKKSPDFVTGEPRQREAAATQGGAWVCDRRPSCPVSATSPRRQGATLP